MNELAKEAAEYLATLPKLSNKEIYCIAHENLTEALMDTDHVLFSQAVGDMDFKKLLQAYNTGEFCDLGLVFTNLIDDLHRKECENDAEILIGKHRCELDCMTKSGALDWLARNNRGEI